MYNKRRALLLALLLMLISTLPALAQGSWYYHWTRTGPNGTPGNSWVAVRWSLAASCEGCTCGSSWYPAVYANLWERPPDREIVSRGTGRTGAGRPACPSGSAGAGLPVAGTWYHNGRANIQCSTSIDHTDWQLLEKWGTADCTYAGIAADWWTFAPQDDCCDGGGCGDDPGGGDPDPCHCPGDSWQYAQPAAGELRWEPPYPVVIGQDPQRRGVDVILTVWIDPATHIWYGPDCPGCTEHRDPVRDELIGVAVQLTLSEASRNWIESELAQRYPGARVRQPEIAAPGTLSDCYYAGNRHVCTITAHLEPIDPGWPVDPGWYEVALTVTSNLAHRVNAVSIPEQVPVYLKDTTIIQ